MNFASAYISMMRGHRIKRHHWSGYWSVKGKEVIMHCKDGTDISIANSEDMTYTLSNAACNDWEIADDFGPENELNYSK